MAKLKLTTFDFGGGFSGLKPIKNVYFRGFLPTKMTNIFRVLLLIWIGILIVVSGISNALPTDTTTTANRFFVFTPGWAFQQGRDEAMSPLIYSGHHFNGEIGLEKTNKNHFNKYMFGAALGRMQAVTQPKALRSRAQALRVQMDYAHLRMTKSWPVHGLELWLGGTWNNVLSLLNHQGYLNNSLNYAFSSSLGVAARLQYPLRLGNKLFSLYGQFELPLLAFNFRPSFASSIPEGYIAQDRGNVRAFFDSGKLQTLKSFFRLRNRLGIHHFLPNGNQISLSYSWDYYQISHPHTVQMALHQILLGWRYKF